MKSTEIISQNTEANIAAFVETPVGQAEILKSARELVEKQPELVRKTFYKYYRILKGVFRLSPNELEVAQSVHESEEIHGGAPQVLHFFRDKEQEFLDVLRNLGDPSNEHTKRGMSDLAKMMGKAWSTRQENPEWSPKDGDPLSDEVIWGFVNGSTDPRINVDFTICHGIERIMSDYFRDKYPDDNELQDFIGKKDWLLWAMTDVILIRHSHENGNLKDVVGRWSTPRPEGLGWIPESIATAYQDKLNQ